MVIVRVGGRQAQSEWRLNVVTRANSFVTLGRIAEDIRLFISSTLDLSIGGTRSLVKSVSFVAILWGLSGTAKTREKSASSPCKSYKT
jgi:ABC-type uncharacterized transport system fused permease/ATPase subunit